MQYIYEFYAAASIDNNGVDEIDNGDILRIDGNVYIRDDAGKNNYIADKFQISLRNVKTGDVTTVRVPEGTGLKPSYIMDDMCANELEYIASKKYTGMKFSRVPNGKLKIGSRVINRGDEYMISQVNESSIGLVNVVTGRNFSPNVSARDLVAIELRELENLIGMSKIGGFEVMKV